MSGDQGLPVTVVVPCFNTGATLDRAIASVAEQTQPPVAVILVDDKSTDDTADRIRVASGKKWPFSIHSVFLGENRGAGGARNAGLDAVREATTYLAFLDADDLWLPQKLERQIGWMESHPLVKWTAHRCAVIGSHKQSVFAGTSPMVVPITRRRLLLRNSIATASVVARTPLLSRFRPGWRHCEDFMLWMDWLRAGQSAVMVEEVLAYLGRPPGTPGGLTGERVAMYRGEVRVVQELQRAKQLHCGEPVIWRMYFWIRQLWRSVRR
jgi:glycosyltransferase involved in cell wall biosynthesis